MAEDYVPECLPFFRDEQLDEEQRNEKVVELVKDRSTLQGKPLDDLALKVLNLCWDRIGAERAQQEKDRAQLPRSSSHLPTRLQITIQAPSESIATRPNLPSTPSNRLAASHTMSASGSGRLNPNARIFTPSSQSASPTSHGRNPNAPVFVPPPRLSQPRQIPTAEERRAVYQSRIRVFNAGISFMDNYWKPALQAKLRQAENEIAVLKAEHDALVEEFFDHYPDTKGDWSLDHGEGAKRVWGWKIRGWQMDCLKLWIKEVAEADLRFLRETREMYFEDLFPREGEMGPADR